MLRKLFGVIFILLVTAGLAWANGDHPKTIPQEADPKAFKVLKEKAINPKTGLPNTLDSHLFKGKARKAYQIAKEIPEVLAQMPCFCECEALGHENLLDCFIDDHAAG